MDVIEIDAASNNGVDNIRELRESVKYPPAVGRKKVYIIDEVHMLSTGAFNALLKTLEEPPENVMFILATTDPQKLPQTILSRCMRLDFKRVPERILIEHMGRICGEKGIEITDGALRLLAANADGSVRDGLSILDQCLSGGDKKLDRDVILEFLGTVSEEFFINLTEMCIRDRLSGTVEMAFTNRTDGNLESIVVRNYPASILKELKKGSAEISAVTAEDGTPLTFSVGKDPSVVTVELGGEGLSPDESTVVRVSYKTDIPKVRERFGVYTEGKDEYYLLTFCFPSLSVFEDGKWNDSPYIFGAESTYSKVCDYKVRFEAPKDFLVAASGEETTKDGVTEIEGKNMRDMSIIASNHMEVQTDTASGIRINNYTFSHPGYSWMDTYNELTMESAKESVTMFSELFGK